MKSGICGAAALICASPAVAADGPVDPERVDLIDAIECRLDAPSYNRFAFALEGEEQIAKHRHWRRIADANPLMHEFELPAPILVAEHYTTRRIAFTASGVLAVIDVKDPDEIARPLAIKNTMDPRPLIDSLVASGKVTRDEVEAHITFRKFLGAKIISESTERPQPGEEFGMHTAITLNVSNASSHSGKTLYGCSYRMELIGKDGKPL